MTTNVAKPTDQNDWPRSIESDPSNLNPAIDLVAQNTVATDVQQEVGAPQTLSFEHFAEHHPIGIQRYQEYVAKKDAHKSLKDELKQLARELNERKQTIDELTASIEALEPLDVNETDNIRATKQQTLKTVKKEYRTNFRRFEVVQVEVTTAKTERDDCMQQLIESYDAWRTGSDV